MLYARTRSGSPCAFPDEIHRFFIAYFNGNYSGLSSPELFPTRLFFASSLVVGICIYELSDMTIKL